MRLTLKRVTCKYPARQIFVYLFLTFNFETIQMINARKRGNIFLVDGVKLNQCFLDVDKIMAWLRKCKHMLTCFEPHLSIYCFFIANHEYFLWIFFLPETSRACSICTLNEILTESWVCEVHNLKKKLGGMSK